MPTKSTIYTKMGDFGITQSGNGENCLKNQPLIELYGHLDELNCTIGLVTAHKIPDITHKILSRIQCELFNLGADLCSNKTHKITAYHSQQLEDEIDFLEAQLPKLTQFIIPQGELPTVHCHLARAVCRRTERSLITLTQQEQLNESLLRYLNRLSDLLFVIARFIAEPAKSPHADNSAEKE